jgi:pimeloyl-ACP methyl ester carboxylesterase
MTPHLLLLPGMMLDRRMYAHQIEALAGTAHVSVPELTHFDSIGALAADVLESAPNRFALAGLSMGGIVALEIWRQAPERVTHLALLNTTPHPDTSQRREQRKQQLTRVEAGNLRELLIDSMKPLYLAQCNRHNAQLLGSLLDQGIELGAGVFRRQSLALSNRCDSQATLAGVDCPALVLCGREDRLCPPEWHVAMANTLPRADLVILAECGHLSPMEQPDAVSHFLRRLMSKAA